MLNALARPDAQPLCAMTIGSLIATYLRSGCADVSARVAAERADVADHARTEFDPHQQLPSQQSLDEQHHRSQPIRQHRRSWAVARKHKCYIDIQPQMVVDG